MVFIDWSQSTIEFSFFGLFLAMYGEGEDNSFVDKNKYIKQNLAAEFESIADRVTPYLENNIKEDFHEFLRAYTDIFTKNV